MTDRDVYEYHLFEAVKLDVEIHKTLSDMRELVKGAGNHKLSEEVGPGQSYLDAIVLDKQRIVSRLEQMKQEVNAAIAVLKSGR